jgi:hypothetical protein
MENPMGEVVIFDKGKNLGFINIPGKGHGIEDPVCIGAEGLAVFIVGVGFKSSSLGGMGKTSQVAQGVFFLKGQKRFEFPGFFKIVIHWFSFVGPV